MMSKKALSEPDIDRIYALCYKETIKWDDVVPANIYEYLRTVELSFNAPAEMSLLSMLAMTSCLCGPNTNVMGNEALSSPLNQFFIMVADPGTGKSPIHAKIVRPGISAVAGVSGFSVEMEGYTNAGLYRHQTTCNGYGLITSDEGAKFLQAVSNKQAKNEGEHSLLCKLWGGEGEQMALKDGDRIIEKTSMSMLLFIQPKPLFEELIAMGTSDGLIDRILFLNVKPRKVKTAVRLENVQKLKFYPNDVIGKTFLSIYHTHAETTLKYTLSDQAEKYFNDVCDEYIDDFNRQYNTDEGTKFQMYYYF
jgi:hypothetical protein